MQYRSELPHMLEVMDFPGRQGHQSPFTARLAGPAESGSQSSDAGTRAGEGERGPHSPGVGWPPSLQQCGVAGARTGPADREEASWGDERVSGTLGPGFSQTPFCKRATDGVPPEEATGALLVTIGQQVHQTNTEREFLCLSHCSNRGPR